MIVIPIAVWKSFVIVLATLVFASPDLAYGCFCRTPSFAEMRDEAAAIFAGKVVAVGALVRFQVSRVYKGRLKAVVEIDNVAGSDCEYGFEVGQEYLVYANANGAQLTTGMCMRNWPLAQADDVRLLGHGRRPIRSASNRVSTTRSMPGAAHAAELAIEPERAQRRLVD